MAVASKAKESEGNPFALKRLASFIQEDGTWLQPKKLQQATKLNLLEHDLSTTMAVVVMKAIDGTCHHAITVHDGHIFDSNKSCAVLLSKLNLNLMCSTDKCHSLFVRVSSGYLFMDSRRPLKDKIQDSNAKKRAHK